MTREERREYMRKWRAANHYKDPGVPEELPPEPQGKGQGLLPEEPG